MIEGQDRREDQGRIGANHDEFLELCALAASGNLNEAEEKKLREHLAICAECRQALEEFESVATEVAPELASEPGEEVPGDPAFSQQKAKAAFEERLTEERKKERDGATGTFGPSQLSPPRSRNVFPSFDRYDLWLPLAASLLLCATLGILSYRMGRNHGIEWARAEQKGQQTQVASSQIPGTVQPDAPRGDEELAQRHSVLAELRREITQKTTELTKLRAQQAEDELRLQSNTQDKKQLGEEKSKLAQERDRLLVQVSAEEATLRETQERLKKLERERSDYVLHTASLETKISELSNLLDERERQATEQQDLLAKDRDIRELIGARDLYITEIYDVARNGDTRKAAGRVFYTKGKSLIFYAYDLKENPGVRDASTFEAWGQRGSDWRQASKLGIFYEDNATKKRWVVKSNDRKALEQLDAVFVTIEPNGGSERPTGKPMLFAYLKVPPNHP